MPCRSSFLAAFAVMGLAGCGLGDERVAIDLDIGRAESAGSLVEITGGDANVLEFGDGDVTLWAQSPVLRVDLLPAESAAETWRVVIRNCMPGSEAVLVDASSGAALLGSGSPAPTTCEFTVAITAGGRAEFTVAPPDAEVAETWRFAFMSDIQDGLDNVDEVFEAINAQPDLRLVIAAGDIVERGKRDEYEQFFHQYQTLNIPFYSTIGNHELTFDESLWAEYFGVHSSHFVFKETAFSLVDSGNAGISPTLSSRLDGWLDDARERVHFFATHFPPLDPIGERQGSFASRREAMALLSRLERAEVDATFYGHIHSYYAYDNAGIPAYISGGGGAIPERFDGIGRHFLAITVSPSRLEEVEVVRVD